MVRCLFSPFPPLPVLGLAIMLSFKQGILPQRGGTLQHLALVNKLQSIAMPNYLPRRPEKHEIDEASLPRSMGGGLWLGNLGEWCRRVGDASKKKK